MSPLHRLLVVVLLLPAMAPVLHGRQAPGPAPVTAAELTPEQMEQFLLHAAIVSRRDSGKGVTDSIRATLSDGRITHDAQIQTVDIHQLVFRSGRATEIDFRDTYRYNIGAYRLSRLLGMTNVPMSVKRRVDGKDAAMTWWVDDVMFDEGERLKHTQRLGPDPERTSKQGYVRLVFDELIQNRDRNLGNSLWTTDWTLWLIDHTRAFRLDRELRKPLELVRCDRRLLEAMRGLTLGAMAEAVGDVMTRQELSAVLARRDLLVRHFEDRIALVGDAAVLFTM